MQTRYGSAKARSAFGRLVIFPSKGSICDIESHLAAGGQKSKAPFGDYDNIDPNVCESLEDDQYLICSYRIWPLVLKTR